jgi:hypothetical protein
MENNDLDNSIRDNINDAYDNEKMAGEYALTPEQIEDRRKAIEWYRNPAVGIQLHEVDPDHKPAHHYAEHIEKNLAGGNYMSAWLGYQQGMHDTLEAQKGLSVFVPCAEDDPRSSGGYTSHCGRSLCFVRETTVPVIQQGSVWVKASERMPASWHLVCARFIHTKTFLLDPENWLKDNERAIQDVEWLDESGGEKVNQIEWDSERMIGRVKERYKELEEKRRDWPSFYSGWLEGRSDMLQQIKGRGLYKTKEGEKEVKP